jgi:hypothetical protein
MPIQRLLLSVSALVLLTAAGCAMWTPQDTGHASFKESETTANADRRAARQSKAKAGDDDSDSRPARTERRPEPLYVE